MRKFDSFMDYLFMDKLKVMETPRQVTDNLLIVLRQMERLQGWKGFWYRLRHPKLSRKIDLNVSYVFCSATELYDVWTRYGDQLKIDQADVVEMKKYTDKVHLVRKTIW